MPNVIPSLTSLSCKSGHHFTLEIGTPVVASASDD